MTNFSRLTELMLPIIPGEVHIIAGEVRVLSCKLNLYINIYRNKKVECLLLRDIFGLEDSLLWTNVDYCKTLTKFDLARPITVVDWQGKRLLIDGRSRIARLASDNGGSLKDIFVDAYVLSEDEIKTSIIAYNYDDNGNLIHDSNYVLSRPRRVPQRHVPEMLPARIKKIIRNIEAVEEVPKIWYRRVLATEIEQIDDQQNVLGRKPTTGILQNIERQLWLHVIRREALNASSKAPNSKSNIFDTSEYVKDKFREFPLAFNTVKKYDHDCIARFKRNAVKDYAEIYGQELGQDFNLLNVKILKKIYKNEYDNSKYDYRTLAENLETQLRILFKANRKASLRKKAESDMSRADGVHGSHYIREDFEALGLGTEADQYKLSLSFGDLLVLTDLLLESPLKLWPEFYIWESAMQWVIAAKRVRTYTLGRLTHEMAFGYLSHIEHEQHGLKNSFSEAWELALKPIHELFSEHDLIANCRLVLTGTNTLALPGLDKRTNLSRRDFLAEPYTVRALPVEDADIGIEPGSRLTRRRRASKLP